MPNQAQVRNYPMIFFELPKIKRSITFLKRSKFRNLIHQVFQKTKQKNLKIRWVPVSKQRFYATAAFVDLCLIVLILINAPAPAERILTPLISPLRHEELQPVVISKSDKEVLGFAPYWNFDKLSNVDFDTLTTFAYFGIEVDGDGNLVKDDPGYEMFHSKKATQVFKKAQSKGTRVSLTITQMNNEPILTLMDNPDAQKTAIEQIVSEVKQRGISGVNVDLEYTGDPGPEYRLKFSDFVSNLTEEVHRQVPSSKVTVSVYASAVKEPKIYDIESLAKASDGIFMMAYDFSVASSRNAIPTAPLYGYKEGKYWYDISTAVEDFLKFMPSSKLILGVPYYGYNWPVYSPEIKADTYSSWYARGVAQTYSYIKDSLQADLEGWDDSGKVAYKAYNVDGTWRMIFFDDRKSLGIKYDFAKEKNLKGVGMWALGMDEGKSELWDLLREKFGTKEYADKNIYEY
ncbi:MAG: Glycosyl hydrolase, family 18 [Candidatus Daviesbacteria bacterium GW2011_GWA2_38_24]|uniref:Glycosyl hydrolase, family 18 n=1 Tax=Candidatus Daviesbacteria bacterium GW2011_GWA2_38_24 TaxID=1618422 RepID=A0A0G0JGH6_9BACT|nr:MAG: Glycosyl hydrolase, family 18 [Candidatus Daviesbacteria bacterium GW2011_GWA2_38_24]